MQAMKTIVFQTGGPFHPVEAQVNLIQSWLPSDWKIKPAFGTEAFEQLADADLYVADELYYNVQIEAGMNAEMHAYAVVIGCGRGGENIEAFLNRGFAARCVPAAPRIALRSKLRKLPPSLKLRRTGRRGNPTLPRSTSHRSPVV